MTWLYRLSIDDICQDRDHDPNSKELDNQTLVRCALVNNNLNPLQVFDDQPGSCAIGPAHSGNRADAVGSLGLHRLCH